MSPPQTIAAFFDLDGTLVPYPSLEWRFISYFIRNKALGWSNAANWMVRAARLLSSGPRTAIAANKSYLAGISSSAAADWKDELSSSRCHPDSRLKILAEGIHRIAWHQSQNHRVFLVSGTLAPLANWVVESLPGTVEVMATELVTESQSGNRNSAIWTGELAGAHMVGEAKRDCVLTLARQHELDLSLSYAYGDSIADCAMLECVGHPEAVNPSRRLRRAARKRGWRISRWIHAASAPYDGYGTLEVAGTLSEVTSARQ
jgi:HAD superfamily hydrolase (TIGR01490 family)